MKKSCILLFVMVCWSLSMQAGKNPVHVWVAGDNTATAVTDASIDIRGWAQELPSLLGSEYIVEDKAQPGATVKSYQNGGYWFELMNQVNKKDILLIQFGVNDLINPQSINYSTIEELEHNLLAMVEEAQKKKLQVILLTPVSRVRYNKHGDNEFYRSFGTYAEATRRVAERMKCQLIDLEAMTAAELEKVSEEEISTYFADETNLTTKGAKWVAVKIAGGMKSKE